MTPATAEFRALALREMGLAPTWVRRVSGATDAPLLEAARTPGFEPVSGAPASLPGASADRLATMVPNNLGQIAAERVQHISRLDWQPLEAEVHACRACPLGAMRTQAVFGVGSRHPDWLFVGEAPGAEEDARGEPFVGDAGRLLDNMLKSIGVSRSQKVYIANVMKCRPPQNRNPESLEVAECSPFLSRQIELLAPRIIVALGRFAAESVLGVRASVGSLRGRVHQVRYGAESFPAVVTYHPAYLLRNLPEKEKAWADLCLARRALHELKDAGTAAGTDSGAGR